MGRTRPVASSMAGDGGGGGYTIATSEGAPKPFGSRQADPLYTRPLQLFHSQDCAKFFRLERHDGEARLTDELNLVQRRLVLNLMQRYRALKRTHRHNIDSAPVFIR